MHCLTCHYELSNLTEHRCPECGRDFDPEKPASYLDLEAISIFVRKSFHWAAAIAFVPLAYMLALFLGALIGYWINPTFEAIFLGVTIQVVLFPLCAIVSLVMLIRGLVRGARCKRLIIHAAFITILAMIVSLTAALLMSAMAMVIVVDS